MCNGCQLLGIYANKNGVSNSRQHIPRVDLADDASFASDFTFNFRAQGQRYAHRCRFDELDAKVASDAMGVGEACDLAVFHTVVISHRRPV
ncbi:hypothetical protein VD17_02820 [Pseudomonas fluorescens]|uniref:Uncharacterized protein n=1 Tax=Pseudomonas fluorescens TaxID=294 RepID=A0A0F4VFP9_PSEFL|nr:hypothetical protein VD17_02820 [Pseudomonas fluorescens]